MPGRDGTGPLGRGPATGRGFGPCGYSAGNRRLRSTALRQPYRYQGREDELAELREEKAAAESELSAIEKRIKELEE